MTTAREIMAEGAACIGVQESVLTAAHLPGPEVGDLVRALSAG
ncbi:hypothetical protein [Streptomyces sp. NPDC008001]